MITLPVQINNSILTNKMALIQPEIKEITDKVQALRKAGKYQEMQKFNLKQKELMNKYRLSSKINHIFLT